MRIGFLGLGAMGSRMSARLVAAGHEVTVWNRSAIAVPFGARLADTPRKAAERAEVVLSMVTDDTASAAVWLDPVAGAFAGMASGALGIECSTLSPAAVRRLHSAAAAADVRFLDAPVAGSRPQAEAGVLIFLVGGSAQDVARAEPLLRAMGSVIHHAGDASAGAVVKLMVNTLFGTQVAVMAEVLALARAGGVDPQRALAILGETPVASAAAKGAGAAMLAGAFAPAFPIALAAKDFGLALQAGGAMPVTSVVSGLLAKSIRDGLGDLNITALGQDPTTIRR